MIIKQKSEGGSKNKKEQRQTISCDIGYQPRQFGRRLCSTGSIFTEVATQELSHIPFCNSLYNSGYIMAILASTSTSNTRRNTGPIVKKDE